MTMKASMRGRIAVLATLAALGCVAHAETAAKAPEAHPLDLQALYVERDGALVLSPAVEHLRGARVRVRGSMIQMEEGPRGAFYLATRPVEQDESGAGTGDIPVNSLLVKVPGAEGHAIPWRPTVVEVVGVLEIGREEDADGRVSSVRVVLAEPAR